MKITGLLATIFLVSTAMPCRNSPYDTGSICPSNCDSAQRCGNDNHVSAVPTLRRFLHVCHDAEIAQVLPMRLQQQLGSELEVVSPTQCPAPEAQKQQPWVMENVVRGSWKRKPRPLLARLRSSGDCDRKFKLPPKAPSCLSISSPSFSKVSELSRQGCGGVGGGLSIEELAARLAAELNTKELPPSSSYAAPPPSPNQPRRPLLAQTLSALACSPKLQCRSTPPPLMPIFALELPKAHLKLQTSFSNFKRARRCCSSPVRLVADIQKIPAKQQLSLGIRNKLSALRAIGCGIKSQLRVAASTAASTAATASLASYLASEQYSSQRFVVET
ncbi:hypothetical protein SVAN01_06704 [Stagonosporopsis vannaccii]|nr:hypothetical protein SVAN01_06704 [Stagonosporopsis vannaccii]